MSIDDDIQRQHLYVYIDLHTFVTTFLFILLSSYIFIKERGRGSRPPKTPFRFMCV